MAVTAPQPRAEDTALLAQQIYYTHCLPADSVAAQAGYSVRATSTGDRAMVQFATDYPAYELPPDLWTQNISPAEAPRRLALVTGPNGARALIHSAYLPEDTRGRKNSFFSHYFFRSSLSPLMALQTWASPDWALVYPQGADKQLGPAPVPRPGPLNERAVTAFLSPAGPYGENYLATALVPARLPPDPGKRQDLLRMALTGLLLATQAGTGSPRGRFYLVAEPGLTALLLYAAVRLLPDALTTDLTFSTYESAASTSRPLRAYQFARVVGTFLGNPQRTLDPEYFSARGYALDTFNNKFSPELRSDAPAVVEDLIGLAARNEWGQIDEVYRLLGRGNVSVAAFRDGYESLKAQKRVLANQATANDLVLLRRSTYGRPFLGQHEAQAWPLIREASLTNEAVRQEFGDALLKRAPELQELAARALGSAPKEWPARWGLLCWVLKDDPARLRKALLDVVDRYGASVSALRLPLLKDWSSLGVSELPPPMLVLLRGASADELNQIAKSDLPREWLAEGLAAALARHETMPAAAKLLHEVDNNVLLAAWAEVPNWKSEMQLALLDRLMPPENNEKLAMLERLLVAGCRVKPKVLDKFLDDRGAYEETWDAFWLRNNHLVRMLRLLGAFGEASAAVWDRFTKRLNARLLLDGSSSQRALLDHLKVAIDQKGEPPPAAARAAIYDWTILRQHFERPAPTGDDSWHKRREACERRGIKPGELLQAYFKQHVLPRAVSEEVLRPFALVLCGMCPPGEQMAEQRERLIAWLKVVEACPDPGKKADYQRYYFENHVSEPLRYPLAVELRKGIHPEVVEGLKPVAPAPQELGGGLEELAAAGPVRASTRSAPAAKQKEGLSAWFERLLWRGVLALVFLAAGVVGGFLLRNSTASKEAETASASLAAAKKETDDSDKKQKAAEKKAKDTKEKLDGALGKVESTKGKLATMQKERDDLKAALATMKKSGGSVGDKLKTAEAKVKKLEGAIERAGENLKTALAATAAAEKRLEDREKQATAEIKLLQRWNVDYESVLKNLKKGLPLLCKMDEKEQKYLTEVLAIQEINLHAERLKAGQRLANALLAFYAKHSPSEVLAKAPDDETVRKARVALAAVFDKEKSPDLHDDIREARDKPIAKGSRERTDVKDKWRTMMAAMEYLAGKLPPPKKK